METVHRFKTGLDAVLRWLCIGLFALMIVLVTWQVIARMTVGGNVWTEVTARIVFIWQGLIGAAYVIGEKEDVAIDFLVKRFPPVFVKAVEIFAFTVLGVFAVWVMIYGGSKYIQSTWNDSVQLLPVSQGQVYLVLPITGVLIILYAVLHIIDVIHKPLERRTGDIDIGGLREEGI